MEYLSYSQVNTFRRSPVDWIMSYIEGIRTPPGPNAIKGIQYHQVLEELIGGKPVRGEEDIDPKISLLANMWMNENRSWVDEHEWVVEGKLDIKLSKDVPTFRGVVDMWSYDEVDGSLRVYDHKMMSRSVWKCRKTGRQKARQFEPANPIELARNSQLLLYSYGILNESLKDKVVNTIEIGQNQKIDTKKWGEIINSCFTNIRATVTMDSIERNRVALIETAYQMLEVERGYKKEGFATLFNLYPEAHGKLEDLSTRITFGQQNPFWEFYKGKESLEDLKSRLKK